MVPLYKNGDLLICRKKFDKYENCFCLFELSDTEFEVDKVYKIINVYDSTRFMNGQYSKCGQNIAVGCDFLVQNNHGTFEENTVFETIKNKINKPGKSTIPYLYDYFYTNQEIRKMKLQKTERLSKLKKLGW